MSGNEFYELVHRLFNVTFFTINQTPVTFTSLVIFLAIFLSFIIFSKIFTRILRNRILSHVHIDEGTKYNLERITRYLIGITGAVVAFQFIGINLSGLAVIFGLLSVGVGFGLQNITSNFVSGLILLFEKPIKVGDRISVGNTEGDVVAINMRSTTISTIDNIAIIVPNADFISQSVINWSYGDMKLRLNILVGVSYSSDLDVVLRCLKEVALENEDVLRSPEPVVNLVEFGNSSWNMALRCWIADPKKHPVISSDLNCAIVRKFRENNVEIPFPQRDLHIRSSISVPVKDVLND